MTRVYCFAEDRVPEEVGLRLAVASLCHHSPTADVVVYRPNPSADFTRWVGRYPRVRVIPTLPAGANSWNCKPHTLLPLLDGGADEAVWLDSDLLITRDPAPLFDASPSDELVATEEAVSSLHQGSEVRTCGWGFPVGRRLPFTVNSCVVRVTRHHIPFLRRWRDCLSDPEYTAAQSRPLAERPTHLLSDQDVLTALVGSTEYVAIPVRQLRNGVDVIHCGGALGYSLKMRAGGIARPVPTFLHAIAGKPWYVLSPEYRAAHSAWFSFYRGLLQETSPYVAAARRYRREVELPCPWMDRGTLLGRALRVTGFGHHALTGLPLTVAATTATTLRRLLRGGRV